MDTVICFGNYIFCCRFKLAILARHQKDSLHYYHNTQILSSSQDRKLWRCNLECMILRPYQGSGARRGGSKDLNPDLTKQKGARDLCLSSPVSFRKRNTFTRWENTQRHQTKLNLYLVVFQYSYGLSIFCTAGVRRRIQMESHDRKL